MHLPISNTKIGEYLITFMSQRGWTTADFSDRSGVPAYQLYEIFRTGEIRFTKTYFAICETIANQTPYSVGFVLNRLRLLIDNKLPTRELDV